MADVSPEDALAELSAAQDALRDARVLLAGDGSDAGVYNRLYYAAFHAAHAALSDRDVNPSSHGDGRRVDRLEREDNGSRRCPTPHGQSSPGL